MRRAPRPLRSALLRSLVVTLVTAGLLYLAWRHFGGGSAAAPVTVTALPVLVALAGSGLFVIGRAWRLRLLLGGRVGMRELVAATGVSWGAGLLLPGPSADATFIVLARRRFGVGLRRGTGVSLLARGLDVVSLGVIVVIGAALSAADEPVAPVAAVAACGVAGAAGLALLAHPRTRLPLLALAGRVRPLRSWTEAASDALDELRSPRLVGLLVLSTAVCRLATLAEYAALFALCGVHVDIWGVWVVLGIRTVLSTIPIQGLAGLGTSQVWWAGGLGLENIAAASVVGVSVTLSLLDLAVSIPVVAACWAVGRRPRSEPVHLLGTAAVLVAEPVELDAAV